MKKIISFVMSICLIICLVGCGSSTTQLTYDRFAKIVNEPNLYYDVDTKIVYFIMGGNISKMSPYYADNGLPYVYNVESNELEEINVIEEMINW